MVKGKGYTEKKITLHIPYLIPLHYITTRTYIYIYIYMHIYIHTTGLTKRLFIFWISDTENPDQNFKLASQKLSI